MLPREVDVYAHPLRGVIAPLGIQMITMIKVPLKLYCTFRLCEIETTK